VLIFCSYLKRNIPVAKEELIKLDCQQGMCRNAVIKKRGGEETENMYYSVTIQ
jgi:hypothetical protein